MVKQVFRDEMEAFDIKIMAHSEPRHKQPFPIETKVLSI